MKQHLYYETLGWGRYRRCFFRRDKEALLGALQEDLAAREVFLTRAGRTGIILSLRAFKLSRTDEVLVPRFMSTCVLDSINQVAAPSLHLTEHTRAVLLYHHWGFPQDYAKAQDVIRAHHLWVIEDCAHGLWGSSQGKPTGTFGHTAIFSLSKLLEMTYAGALKVNDQSLVPVIKDALDRETTLRDFCESLRGEWTYLRFYNAPLRKRSAVGLRTDLLKWYATLLTYPNLTTVRGFLPRNRQELRCIFARQNAHFVTLLKRSVNTSFMLPSDQVDTMAPLCYPVISDDPAFLATVDQWLRQRNIFTGVYHFDVNRCMFDPNYQECVPLPLYASLPDGLYEEFCRRFDGRF